LAFSDLVTTRAPSVKTTPIVKQMSLIGLQRSYFEDGGPKCKTTFSFLSLHSAVLSTPSTPAVAGTGARTSLDVGRTSLDQQYVAGLQMQTINAHLEH
jgi:hypothetical protein